MNGSQGGLMPRRNPKQKAVLVLKLGGSALTDKGHIYTPRVQQIQRAAKQIWALRRKFSLVVVHGAGSYGHIPVKRWKLESGLKYRAQLRHVAATKIRLLEWEMILDRILVQQQVPLIPLLASDWVVTRGGRIQSADLRPIRNWLSIGCVPSVGGDLVADLKNGFSVLSGDQLAAYLAIRLGASQLIFCTDVDGIFSTNPKLDPHARLFEELSARSALRVARTAGISTTPDVTGGMAGKIFEAATAASRGIPVAFVNLNKDKRLTKVAMRQKVLCSRITPS
jgi:isopentenyl phosphate kinase